LPLPQTGTNPAGRAALEAMTSIRLPNARGDYLDEGTDAPAVFPISNFDRFRNFAGAIKPAKVGNARVEKFSGLTGVEDPVFFQVRG
jgi:hypothetical protein